MTMRLAVLGICALLCAGIAAFFISAHGSEAATIGKDVHDFKELSKRFESLADEKGGEYAFYILGIAQLPPNTDLHLLGHVVGDKLYEQSGVDGIAICTQDFRNACSHSIVIGALNDFGSAALPMIRDACKSAPGGPGAYTMCFHGLGHGVLAYYGYSMPETIEYCKQTGTPEYMQREYIECVGGSIMEIIGGGGHDPDVWARQRAKYLSPDDATGLCLGTLMPDDVREICLVYITPYLFEAAGLNLGNPNPAGFPKAFSYCDAIPKDDTALKRACYGGFGKEFVPMAGSRDIRKVDAFNDNQFSRAISWCRMSGNDEGTAYCISEAVGSVFWGGENNPEASFRFCGLVQSGNERDACYERLAGDIQSYVMGPKRSQLCSRVPEKQRILCSL